MRCENSQRIFFQKMLCHLRLLILLQTRQHVKQLGPNMKHSDFSFFSDQIQTQTTRIRMSLYRFAYVRSSETVGPLIQKNYICFATKILLQIFLHTIHLRVTKYLIEHTERVDFIVSPTIQLALPADFHIFYNLIGVQNFVHSIGE